VKRLALAVALAVPLSAAAQPKAAPPPADKSDAKALLASGLKLFQAKDYLGALAVFRDAYERFPSPKILLNIGTTLKALGRNAEAANTYQRYVDAPDADAAKKADVQKVLAELDALVVVLDVTVTPADAEVQIGDEAWGPANQVVHHRITPGTLTVRARKDRFEPSELTVDAASAGSHVPVALRLAPIVDKPAVTPVTPVVTTPEHDEAPGAGQASSSRAFYALAHIDLAHSGAAARIGVFFEVLPRFQVDVAGLFGGSMGAYVGARYAFLSGRFRPALSAGAPIFFEDGAHVGIRGAAGLEVVINRHFSVVAEAGVEHMFNPAMNYANTLFVPAIGAAGRL
jgi:hypothetical protein